MSLDAMRQAYFRDAKASYNDIIWWPKGSGWKNQSLTANTTVRYIYFFCNTRDDGPVVFELPPAVAGASFYGTIVDADNSAYVTGKAKHSARDSWIYIDGETFAGARADVFMDPEHDQRIAWKVLYTSKDTWMGPQLNLGALGSLYNLTMDPYEKYDMFFNGAVSTRNPTTHQAATPAWTMAGPSR